MRQPRPVARLGLIGLLFSLAASLAQAAPALPGHLTGHWFNRESTGEVGLQLMADGACEIYTQQTGKARVSRGCKWAHYQERTYFVYLKAPDGTCAADADFEFVDLTQDRRLDLQLGQGSRFLLEKAP